MIKNLFRDHQYKIIIGAPIIFLMIISTGTFTSGNIFLFTTTSSPFLVAGDDARVTLLLRTETPINAAGGTVTFTPGVLGVTSIDREGSIIDLWSEEPTHENTNGSIQFSGGMVGEKTLSGVSGKVFTITLSALTEGKGVVSIEHAELLAHNGEGTNLAGGHSTLTLYVRPAGKPSPDVNGDGTLTLSDVNMLYLKTFRPYDARYDITGDGKINWGDIKALIALF